MSRATWHLDELFVKSRGGPYVLCRIGPILQHFALLCHRTSAGRHREQLTERLAMWQKGTSADI
jgi:hypothetical protein